MKKIWGLKDSSGKVLRDGCETQWEALRTAKKSDGSYFKKAEALKMNSGAVVYRGLMRPVKTPSYEMVNDHVVFLEKTVISETLNPFTLFRY